MWTRGRRSKNWKILRMSHVNDPIIKTTHFPGYLPELFQQSEIHYVALRHDYYIDWSSQYSLVVDVY